MAIEENAQRADRWAGPQKPREIQHLSDPLIPAVPLVPGLRRQDHVTFVVAPEDEAGFLQYWAARGLRASASVLTEQFPASHTALSKDPMAAPPSATPIAFSVSNDRASPINRLVELYGRCRIDEFGAVTVGRAQHVALILDEDWDMTAMRAALCVRGVRFMTPILMFRDSTTGAYLQQMLVACRVPYGPFVKILQWGAGLNGEPFGGLDASHIDTLYDYYDSYSRSLCCGSTRSRRRATSFRYRGA